MHRIISLLACSALAVAGCDAPANQAEPAAPSKSRPTATQLQALQAKADDACRCNRRRRSGFDDAACWGEFDREIARFEHMETGTLCGPASETWICFGEGSRELPDSSCVLRARAYGACSASEAEARSAAEGGCG